MSCATLVVVLLPHRSHLVNMVTYLTKIGRGALVVWSLYSRVKNCPWLVVLATLALAHWRWRNLINIWWRLSACWACLSAIVYSRHNFWNYLYPHFNEAISLSCVYRYKWGSHAMMSSSMPTEVINHPITLVKTMIYRLRCTYANGYHKWVEMFGVTLQKRFKIRSIKTFP